MGQCHRLRGARLSKMDKRKTTAAGSTGKENHVAWMTYSSFLCVFSLERKHFKILFQTVASKSK